MIQVIMLNVSEEKIKQCLLKTAKEVLRRKKDNSQERMDK